MKTRVAHYGPSELHEVKVLLFCPATRTHVPSPASAAAPAAKCHLSEAAARDTSGVPPTAASASTEATDTRTKIPEAPSFGGRSVCKLPVEIRLPHPSEPSAICSFLVASNNLYEMNSFTRDMGTTSLFLQEVDCVLGSSPVLLTTPIDPLFFFASLLHRHASSDYQPLKQVLQRAARLQDVRHNLQTLAMLPQVCKRLHLISDVHKTQRKQNCRIRPLAVIGEPEDSVPCKEQDVHLDDWCRFSVVKTAEFLEKIIRRGTAAILQQQRKQEQHPRPLFKECVLPGGPLAAHLPQQRSPMIGIAKKGIPNAFRQEGQSATAVAAAKRLVEDCISGYLPKAVLEAVNQQHTRRHR